MENANFPNCLGAIDGKHIRIIKPTASGSLYYNSKNFYSMVLLAVCGAQYNFTYVDIGSFGKESDTSIFKNSTLYKSLIDEKLKIPCAKALPGQITKMPHVFVGDEVFGLSANILRPYAGHNLNDKQKIFNYRLTRARRYIECTFGILSNKWRIFHCPLNVSQDLAIDIVKSCCILHNFARQRDGFNYEEIITQSLQLED